MIGPVIRFCGRLLISHWKKPVFSRRCVCLTLSSNSTRFPLILNSMLLSCSRTALRRSSSSALICSSKCAIRSFMAVSFGEPVARMARRYGVPPPMSNVAGWRRFCGVLVEIGRATGDVGATLILEVARSVIERDVDRFRPCSKSAIRRDSRRRG